MLTHIKVRGIFECMRHINFMKAIAKWQKAMPEETRLTQQKLCIGSGD